MKLHVSKHGHQISEYEFPVDLGVREISIGRSQASHIFIDDPMISRNHVELQLHDSGEWRAIKKVQVGFMEHNGRSCSEAILNVGDTLDIGDYSISFTEINGSIHPTRNSKPVESLIEESIFEAPKSEAYSETDDIERTEILSEDNTGLNYIDEVQVDDEIDKDYSDSDTVSNNNENDDFGNDDFSFDNDGDDDFDDPSEKTGIFTSFATFYLKLFGENVPYDKYKVPEGDLFIGRKSDKCQIILTDEDVSSVHAVIKRNKVSCYLEDLNSANGTLLNGERINRAELVNGDEFIIGSTTFTVEVSSDLMKDERGRLMPVEPNQVVDIEQVVEEEVDFGEIDTESEIDGNEKKSKSILKDPEKRKKVIYGIVGLVLLWVFLDDGDSSKKPKKTTTEKSKTVNDPTGKSTVKQFTKEQIEVLEASYQVGVRSFEEASFAQARDEFARVAGIDPAYKNVETYLKATDKALIELNKAEERKREEEKKRIIEAEVAELLIKGKEAFKDENIELTQFYIDKIAEKDPENLEIPYLRIEVETYIKRKKDEAEKLRMAKEDRDRKLDQLKPGETFYFKREWYKAILKLEEFTRIRDMDSDLIEKAAGMLASSRQSLQEEVQPMIGEARSLKEGQDLKGAYELYSKIYEIDQSNIEALNEMEFIRGKLEKRSMKVYREAIIAESLSLFDEAKEKLQEVQQISPSDSEYYRKATDKLKKYLD